jgi:hypothetical protein
MPARQRRGMMTLIPPEVGYSSRSKASGPPRAGLFLGKIAGMKASITLLRRDGMRLRKDEIAEPLTGEIHMFDWENTNSFRRAIRVLELLQRVGSIDQAAAKLFDPELIAVKAGAMVFRGIVLETRDGRVFEHEQIWRVVPAGGIDPTQDHDPD